MSIVFKKAQSMGKARILFEGGAGSGKTYTALEAATELAEGGKVAVIDSDGGAALLSRYFDFDIYELGENNHPSHYAEAILAAEAQGYAAVIIDSLTLAWAGTRSIVDKFNGWKEATPLWRGLIHTIKNTNIHVFATARTKTEWSVERDERGKMAPREMGQGVDLGKEAEFEFDMIVRMERTDGPYPIGHVRKSRNPDLHGWTFNPPAERISEKVKAWLSGLDLWDSSDFAARIHSLAGLTVGELSVICSRMDPPRPAPIGMTDDQRDILLRWLGTDQGLATAGSLLGRELAAPAQLEAVEGEEAAA